MIKVEWENRARNAEKNLIQLIKELDHSNQTIKSIKTNISNKNKIQNQEQINLLKKIKQQQGKILKKP